MCQSRIERGVKRVSLSRDWRVQIDDHPLPLNLLDMSLTMHPRKAHLLPCRDGGHEGRRLAAVEAVARAAHGRGGRA